MCDMKLLVNFTIKLIKAKQRQVKRQYSWVNQRKHNLRMRNGLISYLLVIPIEMLLH